MNFSENVIAFLAENSMRNDKAWFEEHKDYYKENIAKPYIDLIEYVAPLIENVDPQIQCNSRKLSRIYKDTRFSKDKLYRDSLWISLRRKRERFQCVPEFYFYAGANGFGWGCGYYSASTATMEAVRELVLSEDKTFKAAQKAFNEISDKFSLWGESYKRDRFPNAKESLKPWLNRKTICVSYDSEDPELLYSDNLFETVKNDFEKLAPLYNFYIKAEELRIMHNQ